MVTQQLYTAFIFLLIGERLFELSLSRRHAERALTAGAVEVGQGHFRVMKALHTAFFVGCLGEVWFGGAQFSFALALPMAIIVVLSQALRYWAIATLGVRWNVRVIVLPGRQAVASGPYRFLRHPNYLAVVLEGIAVPLIHGAYVTALVFSVLNAYLLKVRILVEERALAEYCGYQTVFSRVGRLIPNFSGLGGRPPHPGD